MSSWAGDSVADYALLLTIEGANVLSFTLIDMENNVKRVERSVIQGTLDMLILKTLALEPLHGFGITTRVEQISRNVFRVNPGSLFPALKRLERRGLITSEWRVSENNRRAKYYALTQRGENKLREERRVWGQRVQAVTRILEA